MATKKTKAAQPAQPQPAQAPVCRKCGGGQMITQLREVTVTVGWKATIIHAVAPCQVCTKCGDATVHVNADVGAFAGLIPDPETVAARQRQQAQQQAPTKEGIVRNARRSKAKVDKVSKKKATKRKK